MVLRTQSRRDKVALRIYAFLFITLGGCAGALILKSPGTESISAESSLEDTDTGTATRVAPPKVAECEVRSDCPAPHAFPQEAPPDDELMANTLQAVERDGSMKKEPAPAIPKTPENKALLCHLLGKECTDETPRIPEKTVVNGELKDLNTSKVRGAGDSAGDMGWVRANTEVTEEPPEEEEADKGLDPAVAKEAKVSKTEQEGETEAEEELQTDIQDTILYEHSELTEVASAYSGGELYVFLAVARRKWSGYTNPQTMFHDLYLLRASDGSLRYINRVQGLHIAAVE